jgi:hypothetical protein
LEQIKDRASFDKTMEMLQMIVEGKTPTHTHTKEGMGGASKAIGMLAKAMEKFPVNLDPKKLWEEHAEPWLKQNGMTAADIGDIKGYFEKANSS